jgi:hypothetical protein
VQYSYDKDGLVTRAGDLSIHCEPASGRVLSQTIEKIWESFTYNEFAELKRQRVVLLNAMGAEKETLYDVIYDDDGTYGDRDALGRITRKTEWAARKNEPANRALRKVDFRTHPLRNPTELSQPPPFSSPKIPSSEQELPHLFPTPLPQDTRLLIRDRIRTQPMIDRAPSVRTTSEAARAASPKSDP